MSRFRILALTATLVALATALAACGGGSDKSEEDPHKVIESATLAGVKSGELGLSLQVSSKGKEGGNLNLSVSGPFEQGAKGELPKLEMSAKAKGAAQGEKIDFEGGLSLLADHGFIEYEGTDYEIDPTTYGFLQASLEQAQQQGGSEGAGVTACQKAAEGIKFSQFAENLKNEGSAEVGGASTTKVSGDLDVSGAIDALVKLTEDQACASQLEAAGPLPLNRLEKAKGEISKAVKTSHAELYVGEDDIVRKAAFELTVEPPKSKGERVQLQMEITLTGVNEEQSFSEPKKAEPLQSLFAKLGIEPIELLESLQNGGLENLLGELGGGLSGGGSSSGAASGGGGGAAQAKYAKCLENAATSADLQKCASLLR